MRKGRRNPRFTRDQIQAATLAYTEGTPHCIKPEGRYAYPYILIRMCVREALKPASKAFKSPIGVEKARKVICPPEDFPPNGKGRWRVATPAQRVFALSELIPEAYLKKWKKHLREQGCAV